MLADPVVSVVALTSEVTSRCCHQCSEVGDAAADTCEEGDLSTRKQPPRPQPSCTVTGKKPRPHPGTERAVRRNVETVLLSASV